MFDAALFGCRQTKEKRMSKIEHIRVLHVASVVI